MCWDMTKHTISIVTASYHSAATIGFTLRSVADQERVAVQHVVQDGQSNDGTCDIVAKYNQVTFISEADSGIYDGLNKGIANCTGNIIGLLHADDFYPSDTILRKVADRFEANPELMGVYGDLKYVTQEDTEKVVRDWKAGEFSRAKFHFGWMPPHPTIFLRREAYEQLAGFNTTYEISADYDFILRLFQTFGSRIEYLPETLVHMRGGGLSNSGFGNLLKKSKEDFWIALRMGYFAPVTLVCKMLSKLSQFRNVF